MKASYAVLAVFLLSLAWTAASESLDLPSDHARLLRTKRAQPRPKDLLDVLLNVVAKSQEGRLETVNENYDKAGGRISAFVDWLNNELGYKVLTVGDTAVSTDTTALVKGLEGLAGTLINQQYADNAFMKTLLTTTVNTALESTVVNLNISLDTEISLDLIKNIIAVTTINSTTSDDASTNNNGEAIDDGTVDNDGTTVDNDGTTVDNDGTTVDNDGTSVVSRRKRDVGSFVLNLLSQIVRSFVKNAFGPLVTAIESIFSNVTDTLRGLTTTESNGNPVLVAINNVISQVVTPVANFFEFLHDELQQSFDGFVNGGGDDSAAADDGTNEDNAPAEAKSLQKRWLGLEEDWVEE